MSGLLGVLPGGTTTTRGVRSLHHQLCTWSTTPRHGECPLDAPHPRTFETHTNEALSGGSRWKLGIGRQSDACSQEACGRGSSVRRRRVSQSATRAFRAAGGDGDVVMRKSSECTGARNEDQLQRLERSIFRDPGRDRKPGESSAEVSDKASIARLGGSL